MRVLDGAIGIFCAVAGVQPQSEAVWKQADRYRIPRLAFINKMDRTGARFEEVVEEMRGRLGANPVPVQIPVGSESGFLGVVDVVGLKAHLWDQDEEGSRFRETEVPSELESRARAAHRHLVDKLAEQDDRLMEEYLRRGEVTLPNIKRSLREATIAVRILPVLCGAAYRNKGIQLLLDAVVDYLPSPEEIPPIQCVQPATGKPASRKPSPEEPFAALVFKTMSDPYAGRLAFLRVYSGALASGEVVYNASTGRRERIRRLLRIHANERETIEGVRAGDIAAAAGLKKAATGDTLCDEAHPVVLESMSFPKPVVSVAIEPKREADAGRLYEALDRMVEEDPTLRIRYDQDTGETIISGMGELHLEILVERLAREYDVQASVGEPEVAYRETITETAEAEGKFIRQSGGRGQYGHVVMRFEPLPPGTGFLFEANPAGGRVPKQYVPAVRRGIEEAMDNGVLAGYPMVDFRAVLLDGSAHEVDSSETAFRIAASMAYKKGLEGAKPAILEPVMSLEVFTPEEYLGDLISDLMGRAGRVEGIEDRHGGKVVRAKIALRSLFGYTTRLRSLAQGRATHSMQFFSYQRVPKAVQDEIVDKYRI